MPKNEPRVPMRIFVRGSKMKYTDAEEIFRVVNSGIAFYENQMGTKFPWVKYDSIFCPEFRIRGMENVGAVTFSDMFLRPMSPADNLKFFKTVLHELAHMWFGDLVTMVWWTDLWLKESFADFLAVNQFLKNPDLANYSNSNQLFLDFLDTAIQADSKVSTHPI